MSETLILQNAESTLQAGEALAEELKSGSVVALVGELGAGKTHITQGIAKGMGYVDEVTSPTFSLVQEYRDGRLPVFHFDFYRLNDVRELEGIGWDDYLDSDGVIIVEWANLFPEVFPKKTIWIELSHLPEGGRQMLRKG